jgi:hypothetical protein
MSDGYRFELLRLDAEEYARVSGLLRLVFPRARHLTPLYLQWLFAGNPDGVAVGCNAYLGRDLVGHMAAIPFQARMEGEMRPGLYTMNGAVHPDHRGRRLQSGISAAIFEEGLRRGFDYCFATGNKWSTGPLLTRFRMLRPLDARIGLGWPRRGEPPARPSFERLWSEEALRWRLANPEARYRVERRGGGLAVSAPAGLPGLGAILYLGPGAAEPAAGPRAGPVHAWIGLDPSIDWRRSAFLPIPMRLRPSPLNLVYKDLRGGDFVPDPDRLVFQALDMDAF